MLSPHFADRNAALVVAHPAHELRLIGWLEAAKPTVYALTDGRGRRNMPRADRSARLVRSLGCRQGDLFGELTDSGIYASLLRHDHDGLLRVVDRLSNSFVRDRIDMVVVDAHEDAFLSHDVLNAIVRAAVLAASARLGTPIACYDYALEHDPRSCSEEQTDGAIWMRLTPEQLGRKLEAARSYEEVRLEVEEAFGSYGEAAFATECLRPLRDLGTIRRPSEKPIYELHGEQMVREGHYAQVVRFASHVVPLMERLADLAPIRTPAA